jgi:hypothetical protein
MAEYLPFQFIWNLFKRTSSQKGFEYRPVGDLLQRASVAIIDLPSRKGDRFSEATLGMRLAKR